MKPVVKLPCASPEEVGIPSAVMEAFLDALEDGKTEMHGLMVMHHGKVCAQGWWQPYGPGKRHTCHSLTKTYMGTAVGIAIREGLLTLDTLLVDIFPEYREGSTLADVKVRDLLCMGSGVESMPEATKDWVRDFFRQPQLHAPGTAFFYNSAGSTLIAHLIEKVSGEPVYDYLRPRLFDKIGINSDISYPTDIEPELDMWGHRMQATTQDNLLLMKLYMDDGVAGGERILDHEYVKLATSLQNDSSTEARGNPLATDNFVGYGFQMWMCKYPGAYRADGAGGQFSVVIPDKDMIVAITEAGTGAEGPQHTLDCIWDVLLPGVKDEALAPDPVSHARLTRRLRSLSIAAPVYAPDSPLAEQISGRSFELDSGCFSLFYSEAFSRIAAGDEEGTLSFHFGIMEGSVRWTTGGTETKVEFAMDGTRRRNHIQMPFCNSHECYAAGWWSSPDCFELEMHWTEAVQVKHVVFHFAGDRVEISGKSDYMPGNEERGKMIRAEAHLV